jgi:hypothetical protein
MSFVSLVARSTYIPRARDADATSMLKGDRSRAAG